MTRTIKPGDEELFAMTPRQVEVSRALVKRLRWNIPGGQIRDERGVLWRPTNPGDWYDGGAGEPRPDLNDAATAGVLVGVLARFAVCVSTSEGMGTATVMLDTGGGLASCRQWGGPGCTLGTAAALALLDVWVTP